MKLKPVTKLGKRNTATLAMTNYQQTVTLLSFFQFMANLEQDSRPVILTFFKIVTFKLTKSKNRAKKTLQHSFHTTGLSEDSILPKNAEFLQRKR